MRTHLLAAALLLTACTGRPPAAAPQPSTTPPTAPSTVTTTASLMPLYDEWDPKFKAIPADHAKACAIATVQSPACANYLTEIVTLAALLTPVLEARKADYPRTLKAAHDVIQASTVYDDLGCMTGGSTPVECQRVALTIGTGQIGVTTALFNEDIAAK